MRVIWWKISILQVQLQLIQHQIYLLYCKINLILFIGIDFQSFYNMFNYRLTFRGLELIFNFQILCSHRFAKLSLILIQKPDDFLSCHEHVFLLLEIAWVQIFVCRILIFRCIVVIKNSSRHLFLLIFQININITFRLRYFLKHRSQTFFIDLPRLLRFRDFFYGNNIFIIFDVEHFSIIIFVLWILCAIINIFIQNWFQIFKDFIMKIIVYSIHFGSYLVKW